MNSRSDIVKTLRSIDGCGKRFYIHEGKGLFGGEYVNILENGKYTFQAIKDHEGWSLVIDGCNVLNDLKITLKNGELEVTKND